MGFNYALEKRKFEAMWSKTAAWYRSEGMSEDAIESMHQFDWSTFCRERSFSNHTQPLPNEFHDENDGSSLFKKYDLLSVKFPEEGLFGRDGWVESIEDPELARKLKSLPHSYLQILTLVAIEGFSQEEIAKMSGQSRQAINNKIARIRKILK